MKMLIAFSSLLLLAPVLPAERIGAKRVNGETAETARAPRSAAQGRLVQGPLLGISVGRKTGIRLIRGVAGAATLGPALEEVPALTAWAASADGDYFIGVTAEEGKPVIVRRLSAGPETLFPGGEGLRDAIVITSPRGTAAAVYDRGAGRIAVFPNLPDDPAHYWLDAPDTPSGEITALAVRDDGARVLAAAGDSLLEAGRAGGWSHLASLEGPAVTAYLAGSGGLIYADAGARRVYRIEGGGSISVLAGDAGGVTSPAGIAASLDNRRVFVANQDPPAVLVMDLDTGRAALVDCPRVPSQISRLSGRGVFQLTGADDGTIYLLDGEGETPRLAFVPAPAAGGEGGEIQ